MTDAPFDDGDDLDPEVSDGDLAATLASLIRADLEGLDPDAVLRAFGVASQAGRRQLAYAWGDAMDREGLDDWIAGDPSRRARAEQLALRLAPPDPAGRENAAALAAVRAHTAWDRYPYAVIIVPGYTPRDLAEPSSTLHPVARRRVDQAVLDLKAGLAPFLLVTGGAVYPRGTPHAEAMLMRAALGSQGVPEGRVLVDARARHSTTNLRNAGRMMLASGMPRAVITTMGGGVPGSDMFGQDFYFSNPWLSTFHMRCERELGYRVGELDDAGEHHIAFAPSPHVARIDFRSALDP